MPQFRAIILDIGKVVIDYSFNRTFKYWASISGVSPEVIKTSFRFDGDFEKFERGEIEPGQFVETVSKKLGFDFSSADFYSGWCLSFIGRFASVENFLREIQYDYRLVALTNTNRVHARFVQDRFQNTLEVFEKVFYSYCIKARKPEKAAFNVVLDYLALSATSVVFVDDNLANVAAAKELGITSLLAESPPQTINDLKRLLNPS